MSLDPHDPPRIDDQAPGGMGKLVRITRDDGPSDAAMERMAKRLATAGALPSPASQPNERAAPRFAAYKVGFVALAVVGGLVVAWRATEAPSVSATTGHAAAPSVDRVDHVAPETAPARPTEAPLTARGADGSKPAIVPVDALPSVAAPSASASAPALAGSVRGVSVRSSTVSNGSTSAPEIELLQRAKAALASDPARALSITSEQARAYPSGEFVQEREVIAVEALSRLGRKDEASRRARALVGQFPRTPYGARLEVAVGHPL